MRTWKNLFGEIASLENLYLAAAKARKRKTRKLYVEDFSLRRERELNRIHRQLQDGTWRPSPYRQFYVHDPKKRLISAAPFCDRVVHHALCNVLEPILQRRFVADSFSCQKGKGTQAARERARKYTHRYPFALKADIRKFFQSIDHAVLEAKLSRIIRCEPTLELCRLIIASSVDGEVDPVYFAGDDLFSPFARKRGLPIGNLTSQLWANFYLDGMDHFIKETLQAPAYARYTDDFLIWHESKEWLQDCRHQIENYLQQERLVLQTKKTRVFPVRTGVPFLGFRFYPGIAPSLLAECKRRFERRCRRQSKSLRAGTLALPDAEKSYMGWMAFADYANNTGLKQHYVRNKFG